ncbi:MAG: DNA-3-methyladenine glycosylase [Bacteroidales bacterium]|nr:DNA-3-methyladenine glycosylase [Bacteroidales bacterium]MCF8333633.1 DNA-3-methyladenine glycosylase [Bacteroidales bacterium]
MKSNDIIGENLLDQQFFLGDDVVAIARALIGKRLFTIENGILTGGIITETEAYAGIEDRASHAYNGRKTQRTVTMFEKGGIAYIYLCYGIHSLFNIVTNHENIPDAVLIRGIIPEQGIDKMKKRTGKQKVGKHFTNGPGKVAKALGLHYTLSGIPLNQWVSDFFVGVSRTPESFNQPVNAGKRIGVDYAGQDAELPYRFFL